MLYKSRPEAEQTAIKKIRVVHKNYIISLLTLRHSVYLKFSNSQVCFQLFLFYGKKIFGDINSINTLAHVCTGEMGFEALH
jgi:hypothetical protein